MCYATTRQYAMLRRGNWPGGRATARVLRRTGSSAEPGIDGTPGPVTGNPTTLKVLAEVLAELRADGVVGSSPATPCFRGAQYVALIESGCFDVVWLSLGRQPRPASGAAAARRAVAWSQGAFAKGRLSTGPGGRGDLGVLAARAVWVLDHGGERAGGGVRTVAEFDADADAAGRNCPTRAGPSGQVLATEVHGGVARASAHSGADRLRLTVAAPARANDDGDTATRDEDPHR